MLSRELGWPGWSDSHGHVSMLIESPAMPKHAPHDSCQLVGERDRQLVAVQPGSSLLQPTSKAQLLPIARPHQQNAGSLNEQHAQILAAAFRHTPEDRLAACTMLSWHKSDPSSEISAAIKGIALTDGRHGRGGDHRANTRDGFQALAIGVLVGQGVDLAADVFEVLIQRAPVVMETGASVRKSRPAFDRGSRTATYEAHWRRFELQCPARSGSRGSD